MDDLIFRGGARQRAAAAVLHEEAQLEKSHLAQYMVLSNHIPTQRAGGRTVPYLLRLPCRFYTLGALHVNFRYSLGML